MKKFTSFAVVLIAFISAVMSQGWAGVRDKDDVALVQSIADPQGAKNRYEGGIGVSPLKMEMRMLNEAFKNLMECLVLNMPEGIEDPFLDVKKARGRTDDILKNGEIWLPEKSNNIKQFLNLEKQFHKKLDVLIEASRKKDMKKVRDIVPHLLDSCIQCHYKFRG